MKKRLLISLLCFTLCTSMVAEVGAAAFVDSPVSVSQEADIFTDSAITVESESEVVQDNTAEDVPTVEDVPVTEAPSAEDVPVTETPSVEDVPVTETPSVEDVPVTETPSVEDVPVTETPSEEDSLVTEEIPVDIFTSEPTEDLSVSVENDVTDIVNQDGIIHYTSDWYYDENGWKLVKEEKEVTQTPGADGNINDIYEIETVYYTLADGLVRAVTLQSETDSTELADGYYLFDANGYLVTGQYTMQPGTEGYIYDTAHEYYYMDEEHAVLRTGVAEGTAKTPYTSNLGQLQRDYWFWNGTALRYYDESGKFKSVAELKAAAVEKNTYVGYYEINGKYYCLNEDGVPVTGSYKITDGNKPGYYYFSTNMNADGIPGAMITNQWVSTRQKTRWRYYGSDGIRTSMTSMVADLGGALGDYEYLLDRNGYIVKNTPLKVNGVFYYADKNGRIVKDKLITHNGKRYYFMSDGKRATYTKGWYRLPGAKNRYYYFGSVAGRVVEKTGYQRINGDWYYFSKAGNCYLNKWTSAGRYFDSEGKLASGICTIDGNKYFFSASTSKKANGIVSKKKIVKSGGVYYYATNTGALLENGWVKYNGYYYCIENYKAVTSAFRKMNGVNGYMSSTGKYTTGWVIFNNSQNLVKYVNPTGSDFYKNTTAWIGGLQYRFDANGYRVNDRTDEISGPYYVEADIVNCVITIYNKAKTIPVKSVRISPGAASTPTPTGTYYLRQLGRWWTLLGPSYGQYCSSVVGAGKGGIIIHSVPVGTKSVYSFSPNAYKKLGKPASHGCLRCCVADSKWIYDNCAGATIRIFKGTAVSSEALKGPLGRRAIIPATGNYDPTDPAIVGNKYYNKY